MRSMVRRCEHENVPSDEYHPVKPVLHLQTEKVKRDKEIDSKRATLRLRCGNMTIDGANRVKVNGGQQDAGVERNTIQKF
jgi:hypothetical protein